MSKRTLASGVHVQIEVPTRFDFCLLEGENFHSIVKRFVGVCSKSGAPLANIRLAWDDDILGDYDQGRKDRSGWTHQVTRHSDGTCCLGEYGQPDAMVRDCHSQSKCPKCHQYNTLQVTQEAWLDRTTCTTKRARALGYKDCDYEHVYMIGD